MEIGLVGMNGRCVQCRVVAENNNAGEHAQTPLLKMVERTVKEQILSDEDAMKIPVQYVR